MEIFHHLPIILIHWISQSVISNTFTLDETEKLHKASTLHVCWPALSPHSCFVTQATNHIAGTNNNLQNACKLNIYKAA